MTSDGAAAPVVREIRIEAPPEAVFPFFTDPDRMIRWKGVGALLDPTPGGLYRCDMGANGTVRGEFVVVEPPHRLIFTWGWEGENPLVAPGASTIEVTLTPDGDGTLLRLEHRDLPPPAADLHGQGWDIYLPRLALAAAGGDPGPDPSEQGGTPAH